MAKRETKVILNKYISPKEKAKNIFVIACFLLVILTFAIFLTYAYFINEQKDTLVTTKTIDPYITMSSNIVDDTNGQQKDYFLTNTTNYNLMYTINSDNDLFYKIDDDTFSHSSGIIEANETVKVRLVSNVANYFDDKTDEDLGIYVKSTYQFMDKNINNKISYSNLNNTTILNNLSPSVGTFDKNYNSSTDTYLLKVENDVNQVTFNYDATLNGRLFYDRVKLNVGDNERKLVLRASDGTYINTYTVNIHKKDVPKGTIGEFLLYNNDDVLDTFKVEDDNILIKIPKEKKDVEYNYYLAYKYSDNDDYCENDDTCKYCYSYQEEDMKCIVDNKIDINNLLNETLELNIFDKENNELKYSTYKITFEKEA